MARYGVNYKLVAEAAEQLVQKGRQPTVEQVRLILGTGSSTTIANHLRQWRNLQDLGSNSAVNEQIPTELQSLLRNLWEKTIINAYQAVSTKNNNQSYIELKKQCDKYKLNNQRWQKLFQEWQLDKKRIDQEIDFLKKENHMLLQENKRLAQQIAPFEENKITNIQTVSDLINL